MSAADKITGMYTFYRTHIMTITASRALLIINGCKVVNNLNRAFGTGFLTFHTADTAVCANLSDLSAFIVA